MNCKLIIYSTLFLIFIKLTVSEVPQKTEENPGKVETFVPEKEWKTVKPGQPIPQGLHVRHNFETKVTEAKLLDENDDPNKNQALIPVESKDDPVEERTEGDVLSEKMKISLENLKPEEVYEASNDDIERVKKNFRSYEELKKELGQLNLTVKTEIEQVHELVARFKTLGPKIDEDNYEIFKNIYIDLEYLLHQIDNAQEFMKLDGLKNVIYPALVVPEKGSEMQCDALKVFSAAAQHNPSVQIKAFEEKAVATLLEFIDKSVNSNSTICATSALSSLLRRFPTAQYDFLIHHGIEIMSRTEKRFKQHSEKNFNYDKFRAKVLTLLLDLFVDSVEFSSQNNIDAIKVDRFISNRFHSLGYCEMIESFLSDIDIMDFDVTEQLLNVIHKSSDICLNFHWTNFRHGLRKIYMAYGMISDEEKIHTLSHGMDLELLPDEDDEESRYNYNSANFKRIQHLIRETILSIYGTTVLLRDEL